MKTDIAAFTDPAAQIAGAVMAKLLRRANGSRSNTISRSGVVAPKPAARLVKAIVQSIRWVRTVRRKEHLD